MRLQKTKRSQRRSQRRSGAVAVEMAMTLPLLIFIVFSSYEFARANMIRHTVESAAYEGARRGILPGATEQEVRDGVNFVLGSVSISDQVITVQPLPLNDDADEITVRVRVELGSNMLFAPFFLGDGVVERECQMSREKVF